MEGVCCIVGTFFKIDKTMYNMLFVVMDPHWKHTFTCVIAGPREAPLYLCDHRVQEAHLYLCDHRAHGKHTFTCVITGPWEAHLYLCDHRAMGSTPISV